MDSFIKSVKKLIKSCDCDYKCNARRFKQNFKNWTSGNYHINKLIQNTQLTDHNHYMCQALEWIPYDRLYDILYVDKIKTCRAKWIDGCINKWDDENQSWKRVDQNMFVFLKILNNPSSITLEFINEIAISHKVYGITQDPETKNYMVVLNDICEKCNKVCNSIHFQRNFKNWTSGNHHIDKFIQDIQLSEQVENALEWIPYDRLDIYFAKDDEINKVYRAIWIDGCINKWDDENQNLKRKDQSMFIILKILNNPASVALKFINKISIPHKVYGITQDPETKNYMVVLNDICEKCNEVCNSIHFQRNFKNWTSGNNDIDKFIQDTQLSEHTSYYQVKNALEWVPYDKLDTYIVEDDEIDKVYRANWIDGCIQYWNNKNQNWKRKDQNMFVILKILNNLTSITLEFINKIAVPHKVYGITQNPETKNYMFQRNFKNWTSGNNDIDELVKDTQLLEHTYWIQNALEWIPYDRLYDFDYITDDDEFGKVCRAKWIDGYINKWNDENQNWERKDQNMLVFLKIINNPANITLEFINKIAIPYKVYGITQDPKTKNYMVVLNVKCKKCSAMCNSIHLHQNFKNWTSGNNDIDKFIQDTQLQIHKDSKISYAVEWIPYDRIDIYIAEDDEINKVYKANWIDGCIWYWNNENQNWRRKNQNMFITLKILNNPAGITTELNKIAISHKVYGITQDPETKNYMVVLNYICEKCNKVCSSIHFQRNFKNWTSGNYHIDKFIQDTQLSVHEDSEIPHTLEWISYDRFYDILYVDKISRVKWIDGYINKWDDENQNWERKDQNIFVFLKILNNPASITLEFINKIAVPHKVYGITQDPKTKNYMIVLNDICEKCNEVCNSIHFQRNFKNWTSGNNDIDEFIQDTQLQVHHNDSKISYVVEWIPYDRFYDIIYIAKGGFGKVYRAKWIDGYIDKWDDYNQNWERKDQNMVVALKNLNNSKNITLEFMNEITLHHKVNLYKRFIKFYGITQDPKSENYIMVLDYAENGSLRNYLDTSYNKLSWSDKINYLYSIAHGLKDIHEIELIHRDLHIGNILRLKNLTCITDFGFCKPADYNASENAKNKIYNILPYIAPEILHGQNYTKAADIYSFGIIMYEVISGLPPYYDLGHDIKCLDANPLNRPNAEEIKKTLSQWLRESSDLLRISNYTSLQKQIKEADEINNSSSNSSILTSNLGTSYKTHSEAIYTSRLLDFNNLPGPKNSDDYYEDNDNIISIKFSETLQIDDLQLKIIFPEPNNSDDSYEKNDDIISMNSSESLQIDISQMSINKDDQNSKSKGEEKII
ncbi:hypothetical protein RhiirC2_775718 [Rhizophagus irregularis]|uniref:Protein kinase domain-containing protein n=1 Tax=Rhizophagus irregularis TaxID=588596 RepID=A0A2N1NIG3_9GLOM|nr:hypothetical protein RhiirC2_775718 [Rhizophagus irregularis]